MQGSVIQPQTNVIKLYVQENRTRNYVKYRSKKVNIICFLSRFKEKDVKVEGRLFVKRDGTS